VIALAAALAACGRFDFDPLASGTTSDAAAPRDGIAGSGAIALHGTAFGQVSSPLETATASFPQGIIQPGDLLLVGGALDGTPPTNFAVGDSANDPFSMISTGSAAPFVVYLFYGYARSSGALTITATIDSTPNTFLEVQAWAFGGMIDNAGPDDVAQAVGQSLATDGAATRPLLVSQANELVLGWGVFYMTGSPGTGFTQISDASGDPAEDLIAQAPGQLPVTMTMAPGGTNWTIVGATFRGD
jgi:hypothetical protein